MTGFSDDSFRFLAELEQHNDRDWFKENQLRFEQHLREPALRFIDDVGAWIEAAGLPYVAVVKKVGGSLSKIQRDVRFSKDKTPYHSHITIHFANQRGTEDRPLPVLGLRLDANGIGAGAGLWHAPTPVLNHIRDGIIKDPVGWKAATQGVRLDGERLATAPRGYDKDHPLIEDLRLKQFLGHVEVDQAKFCAAPLETFQDACEPLFEFAGWLSDRLGG